MLAGFFIVAAEPTVHVLNKQFLLPFTIGACKAVGGNILKDAFGTIAMAAMAPLVTIQIMGLIYKIKVKNTEAEEESIMAGFMEVEKADDYLEFKD